MKEKRIIVTVDASGNPEIEAEGFSDGACLAETKDLEEALGSVTARTKKHEGFVAVKGTTKVLN